MRRYGFFHPRTIILIMLWISLILTVVILFGVIGILAVPNELGLELKTDQTQALYFTMSGAIVLFFVGPMTILSLIRTIILIKFFIKYDIQEIANNRFILLLLAIGVSTFVVPAMLKRLPNSGVESSVPVKYTVGKFYSLLSLIGGITGFISMGAYFLFVQRQILPNDSFANKEILYTYIAFGSLFSLELFIGLITTPVYWAPNSLENYENKTASGKYMYRFGVIFCIAATVILLFAILSAILEILGAIARLFDKDSGIAGKLMAFLNLGLTLVIQGYIIHTCAYTMKGIWSKADKVVYSEYTKLSQRNDFRVPIWD